MNGAYAPPLTAPSAFAGGMISNNTNHKTHDVPSILCQDQIGIQIFTYSFMRYAWGCIFCLARQSNCNTGAFAPRQQGGKTYGIFQQRNQCIADFGHRPGRRPVRVGRHQPSGRLRPGQPGLKSGWNFVPAAFDWLYSLLSSPILSSFSFSFLYIRSTNQGSVETSRASSRENQATPLFSSRHMWRASFSSASSK